MDQQQTAEKQVVIIGAGPAGLTAAYELTKRNVCPIVIEKRNIVGGLARTESYKGFYFDMGGHRFFTKVPEVKRMWNEILGKDFLRRPRLSRIYYKKKFFNYPLKSFNALKGLGLLESLFIILSYLRWQIFPYRREDTFEQWVTNRFGKRLFQAFFKGYTEKVWGIPCSELKAEWAAQRIKDLSLKTAVLNMFLKPKKTIKTLIEEFEYPRFGPGMMWNAVKSEIDGRTEFIKKLNPSPPPAVLQAAEKIHYRDFLTVCLVVNKPELFPDNWIYIHDPDVKVGRIQNFKNWSPEMVPDPAKTSLGLEYFCTEGDELWNMADAELIELGKREVDRVGLASYTDIEDGCVCRVPKAYPVYDSDYRDYLVTVREFIDGLENFQTIGRNGLHRYNNQDHAMLTGMLAVRNLTLGEDNDLWNVNTDHEYLEEVQVKAEVEVEKVVEAVEGALARVFLRLDRLAFGLSLGITSGLLLFLATIILVLKGGGAVGPNLQLLSQYFPGYSVTLSGSVLGLGYGFVSGFVAGGGFAFLRTAAGRLPGSQVGSAAPRPKVTEV